MTKPTNEYIEHFLSVFARLDMFHGQQVAMRGIGPNVKNNDPVVIAVIDWLKEMPDASDKGGGEICKYCGETHGMKCPIVKAINYRADGSVERVEFLTPTDYHPVAMTQDGVS